MKEDYPFFKYLAAVGLFSDSTELPFSGEATVKRRRLSVVKSIDPLS